MPWPARICWTEASSFRPRASPVMASCLVVGIFKLLFNGFEKVRRYVAAHRLGVQKSPRLRRAVG